MESNDQDVSKHGQWEIRGGELYFVIGADCPAVEFDYYFHVADPAFRRLDFFKITVSAEAGLSRQIFISSDRIDRNREGLRLYLRPHAIEEVKGELNDRRVMLLPGPHPCFLPGRHTFTVVDADNREHRFSVRLKAETGLELCRKS